MELSTLWRLPRMAALDGIEAWESMQGDEQDASHLAWGPAPWVIALGLALAAGLGIGTWTSGDLPGASFPGTPALFALLGAWRLRRALAAAPAGDWGIRSLLVPSFVALALSVSVAFVTRRSLAGHGLPSVEELLGLVERGLLTVAVGIVVMIALSTTRDWLTAVFELFGVLLGFAVTVWVTRFVAEFATLGTRILVGIALGIIGLELPPWLERVLPHLADTAFAAAVAVYIVAACWLTAIEVLPAVARGEKRAFASALDELLQGPADDEEEEG